MAHSKIGFHVGVGGNHDGLGDWMRRINKAGYSFGLKSIDSYGQLGEALQVGRQYGISNWLIYRMAKASGKVSRETPIYTNAPQQDAIDLCREVISKLPPEFDQIVWLELLNEIRGKLGPDDQMYNNMSACDYIGEWCLAAARFLNERGYKFVGPSFNSGEPGENGQPLSDAVTQYSQPGMLEYLRYCAKNSGMAGLSVHEYSWDRWMQGEAPANWYPALWGRFEAAIAAADLNNIPRTFPIFVTEFGFGFDEVPTYPSVTSYFDARNQQLARWPQVKFDAAWALQKYGRGKAHQQANTWMQYDATKVFPEGVQPATTHASFGSTLPSSSPPPSPSRPTKPKPGDTRYVAAKVALNMRSGPSTAHEVIRALSRGTAVKILETGRWSKIQVNGNVGFVASRFLSPVKLTA